LELNRKYLLARILASLNGAGVAQAVVWDTHRDIRIGGSDLGSKLDRSSRRRCVRSLGVFGMRLKADSVGAVKGEQGPQDVHQTIVNPIVNKRHDPATDLLPFSADGTHASSLDFDARCHNSHDSYFCFPVA